MTARAGFWYFLKVQAKLISLIFLFTFLCSSLVEAKELKFEKNTNLKSLVKKQSKLTSASFMVKSPHGDDCNDDGCQESGHCCDKYCTCTTFLLLSSKNKMATDNESYFVQLEWHFYNTYRPPLLESALKPPLYS